MGHRGVLWSSFYFHKASEFTPDERFHTKDNGTKKAEQKEVCVANLTSNYPTHLTLSNVDGHFMDIVGKLRPSFLTFHKATESTPADKFPKKQTKWHQEALKIIKKMVEMSKMRLCGLDIMAITLDHHTNKTKRLGTDAGIRFLQENADIEWKFVTSVTKESKDESNLQEEAREILNNTWWPKRLFVWFPSQDRGLIVEANKHVFRDENMKVAIHTNNGVERQNETIKYSHLEGRTKCSLAEMLTVVMTDFLEHPTEGMIFPSALKEVVNFYIQHHSPSTFRQMAEGGASFPSMEMKEDSTQQIVLLTPKISTTTLHSQRYI
uniref:Uncharacterized protein n=1 Tax=Branchiostoma floridae TaxID=7739 RepID=C3Y864_BRAFL|eukprot:XP_002607523.1 hypothetical protein BRAFLDRAFT_69954 [Branchiostoma floridae]